MLSLIRITTCHPYWTVYDTELFLRHELEQYTFGKINYFIYISLVNESFATLILQWTSLTTIILMTEYSKGVFFKWKLGVFT